MSHELIKSTAFDTARIIDAWPPVDPLDLALAGSTGLGTDAPVLMVPVGLSARFSPDRTQLRVRIQPDVSHVDTLRYTLTDREVQLGAEFWQATAADRDAAWQRLVNAVGGTARGVNRAAWIARSTDPAGAGPATSEPEARCMAMPTRWLVLAFQGTTVVAHETTADIDPRLPVDAPSEDTPAHEWLVNYDAAVAAGMAVTLTLPAPTGSIDLLLAVGVRDGDATAPAAGADEVTRLLGAHRYTGGVEFLAQGTPTNNTPQVATEWRSDPDPADVLHRELDGVAGDAGSDGDLFARALGLAPGTIAPLRGAAATEQRNARAMLHALWPVTGAEFLDVLMTDNVGTGTPLPLSIEDFARGHAGGFVRGRGPLPVLRIGRQPFGILPATSLHRWQPHAAEPALLTGLAKRLATMWPFWEDASDSLVRVGEMNAPSNEGAATVVARILGQSPVPDPTGYMAWTIWPPNLSYTIDPIQFTSPVAGDLAAPLLGTGAHPSILDTRPATEHPATVVCPVADTDTPQRLADLAAAASNDMALRIYPDDPTDLITQVVRRGLLRALNRDLKQVALGLSELVPAEMRYAATLIQSSYTRDLDAAAVDFGAMTLSNLRIDTAAIVAQGIEATTTITDLQRDRTRLAVLLPDYHPAPEHADAAAALDVLKHLAPDDLTRLFGETVDLFANRYDAWVTSLATRRLDTLRTARPTGVHLGGYGWLVDVTAEARVAVTDPPPGVSPTEPAPLYDVLGDAGMVHAPSLQHAATAAVLRHADLGDRAEGLGLGDTERRFDLTSASARRARWLVEAVEGGQPLAAVLGYRVERLLQDLGRAELIAPLRQACPLISGETADTESTALSIPPHDVVDGIMLWRRLTGDLPDAGRPPLPAGLPGEVLAEVKFSVDAVADLLVVEGVHHIVGGDHARAQATLTGLARGQSIATDLRSLDEMRDRLSIPVLLCATITDPAPIAGWDRTRARAVVAPAAEAYAERLLPDPAAVVVTVDRQVDGQPAGMVDVSLASLGLCALDVVNEGPASGGGGSLLEARFLAAAGPGARRVLDAATGGHVGWATLVALAQRARTVLAAARPLTAPDLAVERVDTVDGRAAVVPQAPPSAAAAAAVGTSAAALAGQLELLAAAADALDGQLVALSGLDTDATLTDQQLGDVRAALAVLATFGVPGSVPLPGEAVLAAARAASSKAAAARTARDALRDGPIQIDGAPVPAGAADGSVARLVRLSRDVFGPATVPAPVVDLPDAGGGPPVEPTALADWIGELSEVRDSTRRVHGAWLATAVVTGADTNLRGTQYPVVPGESWLGGFNGPPQQWTPPRGVRRAMIADHLGSDQPVASGLVLDSWVEEIPVPDDETTGLAVNINASDARPPQSWLLAVPPDPSQTEWRLGDLVAVVTETLELARFRAVEPPPDLPHRQFLPLVYVPDGIAGTQPFSKLFVQMAQTTVVAQMTPLHAKSFGSSGG